jgi:translation initiation factor IF-3
VPIPRRFDRRPPERDRTRINERIRAPELRLIGDDGEQVGIVKRDDALTYARERDLDLVEIAPEAKPPVCRVLDYSKYKYEQEQRRKAARKHQQQVTVREMKLRPKIATHDYETKKGHVLRFLKQSDKVKITIMFRGREVAYPERGKALLMRLADDLAEYGTIEQEPSQEGRNMTMLLTPARGGNSRRPERAAGNGQRSIAAASGDESTEETREAGEATEAGEASKAAEAGEAGKASEATEAGEAGEASKAAEAGEASEAGEATEAGEAGERPTAASTGASEQIPE